jgi:hypothetical protein
LLIAIYGLEALIASIVESAESQLLAQFVTKHLPVHDGDTLHLNYVVVALG